MSKSINLVFSIREPNKFQKLTYNALDTMIENLPGLKRYVLGCLPTTYEQLKKLPEAYFRGRWLYIDYKGTTTLVKKVVLKRQPGLKTMKINRYVEEPLTPVYFKTKVYHNEPVPENEVVNSLDIHWDKVEIKENKDD